MLASLLKDQDDESKKAVTIQEQELKQKKQFLQMEMATAGNVLDFGLQQLD